MNIESIVTQFDSSWIPRKEFVPIINLNPGLIILLLLFAGVGVYYFSNLVKVSKTSKENLKPKAIASLVVILASISILLVGTVPNIANSISDKKYQSEWKKEDTDKLNSHLEEVNETLTVDKIMYQDVSDGSIKEWSKDIDANDLTYIFVYATDSDSKYIIINEVEDAYDSWINRVDTVALHVDKESYDEILHGDISKDIYDGKIVSGTKLESKWTRINEDEIHLKNSGMILTRDVVFPDVDVKIK